MQEILKKIHNVGISNINIYLFSKSRDKNDFEVFSTITDDNIINEDIKSILETQIRNYISDMNHEILDYNPVFEDKNIVQRIQCKYLGLLPKFIDKIRLDNVVYSNKKLKKGHKLWLVVVVFDNDDEKIIAFQKLRTKTLLENKKKWYFIEKKLKKFDSPLLQLENTMDCMVYFKGDDIENQFLYIFNKYYFEMIFGFEQKFKNEITQMLNDLEKSEEFDNTLLDIHKLYGKIENNSRNLKKLYVILKNKNFKYLTKENIEKIEYKSNIKFNRSSGELELNSNDDVKKILNFLNEDFLESIVSEKAFVSSNKRDI